MQKGSESFAYKTINVLENKYEQKKQKEHLFNQESRLMYLIQSEKAGVANNIMVSLMLNSLRKILFGPFQTP